MKVRALHFRLLAATAILAVLGGALPARDACGASAACVAGRLGLGDEKAALENFKYATLKDESWLLGPQSSLRAKALQNLLGPAFDPAGKPAETIDEQVRAALDRQPIGADDIVAVNFQLAVQKLFNDEVMHDQGIVDAISADFRGRLSRKLADPSPGNRFAILRESLIEFPSENNQAKQVQLVFKREGKGLRRDDVASALHWLVGETITEFSRAMRDNAVLQKKLEGYYAEQASELQGREKENRDLVSGKPVEAAGSGRIVANPPLLDAVMQPEMWWSYGVSPLRGTGANSIYAPKAPASELVAHAKAFAEVASRFYSTIPLAERATAYKDVGGLQWNYAAISGSLSKLMRVAEHNRQVVINVAESRIRERQGSLADFLVGEPGNRVPSADVMELLRKLRTENPGVFNRAIEAIRKTPADQLALATPPSSTRRKGAATPSDYAIIEFKAAARKLQAQLDERFPGIFTRRSARGSDAHLAELLIEYYAAVDTFSVSPTSGRTPAELVLDGSKAILAIDLANLGGKNAVEAALQLKASGRDPYRAVVGMQPAIDLATRHLVRTEGAIKSTIAEMAAQGHASFEALLDPVYAGKLRSASALRSTDRGAALAKLIAEPMIKRDVIRQSGDDLTILVDPLKPGLFAEFNQALALRIGRAEEMAPNGMRLSYVPKELASRFESVNGIATKLEKDLRKLNAGDYRRMKSVMLGVELAPGVGKDGSPLAALHVSKPIFGEREDMAALRAHLGTEFEAVVAKTDGVQLSRAPPTAAIAVAEFAKSLEAPAPSLTEQKLMLADRAIAVVRRETGDQAFRLTAMQAEALWDAHAYGAGQEGRLEGTLAGVGNYKPMTNAMKLRKLMQSGLTPKVAQLLADRELVGIRDFFGRIASLGRGGESKPSTVGDLTRGGWSAAEAKALGDAGVVGKPSEQLEQTIEAHLAQIESETAGLGADRTRMFVLEALRAGLLDPKSSRLRSLMAKQPSVFKPASLFEKALKGDFPPDSPQTGSGPGPIAGKTAKGRVRDLWKAVRKLHPGDMHAESVAFLERLPELTPLRNRLLGAVKALGELHLGGVRPEYAAGGTAISVENAGIKNYIRAELERDPQLLNDAISFYSKLEPVDYRMEGEFHDFSEKQRSIFDKSASNVWKLALESTGGDPVRAMKAMFVFGHDDIANQIPVGEGPFSAKVRLLNTLQPEQQSALYTPGSIPGLEIPVELLTRFAELRARVRLSRDKTGIELGEDLFRAGQYHFIGGALEAMVLESSGFTKIGSVDMPAIVAGALGRYYKTASIEAFLSPEAIALRKAGYTRPGIKSKLPPDWKEGAALESGRLELDIAYALVDLTAYQHRAGAEWALKHLRSQPTIESRQLAQSAAANPLGDGKLSPEILAAAKEVSDPTGAIRDPHFQLALAMKNDLAKLGVDAHTWPHDGGFYVVIQPKTDAFNRLASSKEVRSEHWLVRRATRMAKLPGSRLLVFDTANLLTGIAGYHQPGYAATKITAIDPSSMFSAKRTGLVRHEIRHEAVAREAEKAEWAAKKWAIENQPRRGDAIRIEIDGKWRRLFTESRGRQEPYYHFRDLESDETFDFTSAKLNRSKRLADLAVSFPAHGDEFIVRRPSGKLEKIQVRGFLRDGTVHVYGEKSMIGSLVDASDFAALAKVSVEGQNKSWDKLKVRAVPKRMRVYFAKGTGAALFEGELAEHYGQGFHSDEIDGFIQSTRAALALRRATIQAKIEAMSSPTLSLQEFAQSDADMLKDAFQPIHGLKQSREFLDQARTLTEAALAQHRQAQKDSPRYPKDPVIRLAEGTRIELTHAQVSRVRGQTTEAALEKVLRELDVLEKEIRRDERGVKEIKRLADEYSITRNQAAKRLSENAPGFDATKSLSSEDIEALRLWLYSGGTTLNQGLRISRELAPPEVALRDRMERILKVAPIHEGVVYRGVELPAPVLTSQFEVGKAYSDPAFLSFSESRGVATSQIGLVDGKINVEFQVRSKTGRSLGPLQRAGSAAEIVFERDTPFKVVSRRESEGRTIIELEEMPRGTKAAKITVPDGDAYWLRHDEEAYISELYANDLKAETGDKITDAEIGSMLNNLFGGSGDKGPGRASGLGDREKIDDARAFVGPLPGELSIPGKIVYQGKLVDERQLRTQVAVDLMTELVKKDPRFEGKSLPTLAPGELEHLWTAHLIGKGEPGPSGAEAGIRDYTPAQIEAKRAELRKIGLDRHLGQELAEDVITMWLKQAIAGRSQVAGTAAERTISADQLRAARIVSTEELPFWQRKLATGGDKLIGTLDNGERVLIKTGRSVGLSGAPSRKMLENVKHEAAVFEIARILGFDIVPPTVLRTIEIGGKQVEVSVQKWIEGAGVASTTWNDFRNLLTGRGEDPFIREFATAQGPARDRLNQLFVLDTITRQVDRNGLNAIREADGTLHAIDNARSFAARAKGEYREHIELTPEIRASLQRLKDTDRARFANLLTAKEHQSLLQEVDRLLETAAQPVLAETPVKPAAESDGDGLIAAQSFRVENPAKRIAVETVIADVEIGSRDAEATIDMIVGGREIEGINLIEPDVATPESKAYGERMRELAKRVKAKAVNSIKLSREKFPTWFENNKRRLRIIAVHTSIIGVAKGVELIWGPHPLEIAPAIAATVATGAAYSALGLTSPAVYNFITNPGSSPPVTWVLKKLAAYNLIRDPESTPPVRWALNKLAAVSDSPAWKKAVTDTNQMAKEFARTTLINTGVFEGLKLAMALGTGTFSLDLGSTFWLSVLNTKVSFPTTKVIMAYRANALARVVGDEARTARVEAIVQHVSGGISVARTAAILIKLNALTAGPSAFDAYATQGLDVLFYASASKFAYDIIGKPLYEKYARGPVNRAAEKLYDDYYRAKLAVKTRLTGQDASAKLRELNADLVEAPVPPNRYAPDAKLTDQTNETRRRAWDEIDAAERDSAIPRAARDQRIRAAAKEMILELTGDLAVNLETYKTKLSKKPELAPDEIAKVRQAARDQREAALETDGGRMLDKILEMREIGARDFESNQGKAEATLAAKGNETWLQVARKTRGLRAEGFAPHEISAILASGAVGTRAREAELVAGPLLAHRSDEGARALASFRRMASAPVTQADIDAYRTLLAHSAKEKFPGQFDLLVNQLKGAPLGERDMILELTHYPETSEVRQAVRMITESTVCQ